MKPTPEASSPETAAAVLAFLAEHPTAGIREIGRGVGRGRSTAARAVSALIQAGRVVVERRGTGDRYPSRYRVVA